MADTSPFIVKGGWFPSSLACRSEKRFIIPIVLGVDESEGTNYSPFSFCGMYCFLVILLSTHCLYLFSIFSLG